MKALVIALLIVGASSIDLMGTSTFPAFKTEEAEAKWVNGYYRSNGTYVSGHYRDTSNDGNNWNNVNFLN